jgi:iron complex transport system permease protein
VYWLLTVGDVDNAARATTWIVGSLADVGWEPVGPVLLALAVLAPITLVAGHTIGGLQFGDDTARGLGIRVDAARGTLLRLVRSAQPPLVGSMVLGALLTVGADFVVRVTPSLSGLPVGVLTAILGAPYLIFLFVRTRSTCSTWCTGCTTNAGPPW